MCVYLESKLKGPLFPNRCPQEEGREGWRPALLSNEVPGACFQPAKVSRLRWQIVEADKHP